MGVERKYERDIDLLLAEELVVNTCFAAWFASSAGVTITSRLLDVWVSKSDNLGESDLIALYEGVGGVRVALMVEDKVDAPLQPDQAHRYRLRGAREIESGLCNEIRVVLCAPANYLAIDGVQDGFDCSISFEAIAYYLRAVEPTVRANYRANFLETAASRRANTWKREVDDRTQAFWGAAYEVASREFPELEMKPLTVTKGSTWINFRPRDFPTRPQRIYISVKGDRGQMDLTFSNTSLPMMQPLVTTLLDPDMTVHQTSASTAIRLQVDGFQTDDELGNAIPRLRAAFTACARLIAFYRAHRQALNAAAREAAT